MARPLPYADPGAPRPPTVTDHRGASAERPSVSLGALPERVVVVGAGVSGLTAAYRLLRGPDPRPEVLVVEAEERAGGKLGSATVGDFELEAGADSFVVRKPWAADLARELGLGDDLITPAAGGTLLWTERGLIPFLPGNALGVPGDVGELLRWSRGLSWAGRLRAASEPVRRRRAPDGDESLGSLVRRRLGDEVADRLVQPLLGGLLAGDIDRLSVRATFPELAAWERDRGSLVRGARATTRRARSAAVQGAPVEDRAPAMFEKLRGGVQRLTDALAAAIGPEALLLGHRASAIRPEGRRFAVDVGDRWLMADAVVLATPSFLAADLVADVAPEAVEPMRSIPHASTAVVLLVYAPGSGDLLPPEAGFVVPRGRTAMTACTFVSRKWPEPAFGDRAVARCFVGGGGDEGALSAGDEELVRGVAADVRQAVGDLPEAPEASTVVRWERAMPQYEVGHVERVAEIEGGLRAGLFVTGASYRGVGVPDCVRQAEEAAERVRAYLAAGARETA